MALWEKCDDLGSCFAIAAISPPPIDAVMLLFGIRDSLQIGITMTDLEFQLLPHVFTSLNANNNFKNIQNTVSCVASY